MLRVFYTFYLFGGGSITSPMTKRNRCPGLEVITKTKKRKQVGHGVKSLTILDYERNAERNKVLGGPDLLYRIQPTDPPTFADPVVRGQRGMKNSEKTHGNTYTVYLELIINYCHTAQNQHATRGDELRPAETPTAPSRETPKPCPPCTVASCPCMLATTS